MRTRTHAVLLSLCGLILAGMGAYFIFLRPPLLPEDLRAIGATPEQLEGVAPGLSIWLRRVFWVMGGYIMSTGVLTLYVATQGRDRLAAGTATLAGLTSIGWMVVVNFVIDSDFKWLLLGFALLWAVAAASYWLYTWREKTHKEAIQ